MHDQTINAAVPPHSDEAEQSVLGAVLVDNAAYEAVGSLLQPGHWYRPDHRAIWQTIGTLINGQRAADVVTVFEAGGHDMAYLHQLAASVPSASRAGAYAAVVVERWRERELARIGAALAAQAMAGVQEEGGVPGVVDKAVTALMQLVTSRSDRAPQHVRDLAMRFVDHLNDLVEGRDEATATGLRDLDKLTAGGIRPGELWVIGARPSMGKTALTGALARMMAKQKGVLFLSQEDSFMALTARHVAALGRVNLADLRRPQDAPEAMWSGLTEGVDELSGLDLWLDDQAGLTMADVRRKIQAVAQHTTLGVVVIDYLQLMEGEGDNRNLQLGRIANGLKKAAKDFGLGLILLSQLNREVDKRTGPPQMSDLRDSGDIEGAADLIGLLHREYKRNPCDANKHHAELHVVKHKNGATDTINLWFDGAYQRFGNWDGPPPSKMRGRAGGVGGGLD